SNWTPLLNTVISQVAAGVLPATRIDGPGYVSSTSSFPFAGLSNTGGSTGGPKAYLNWLVFDDNYLLLDAGFRRLSATPKETGQNVAHEKLSASIQATQAGYVYVFISNEETTPVEVYFDDFRVEHIKSPVIESQSYYPFGLAHSSYQRENSLNNQYQYNGKELQDELSLGWLDYGARMYMPEIGRWGIRDSKG
ncbi:MAG: hypothetical protein JNK10_15765, partial [Cyclobacteriaceae bacterium]|nr:hypothetical protein [Cyclobacteriaceae bacterium]